MDSEPIWGPCGCPKRWAGTARQGKDLAGPGATLKVDLGPADTLVDEKLRFS